MNQMIPGRDFWNYATEFLVLSDLGSDFARQQFAVAQNRDRGFVARRLKSKNCFLFHRRVRGERGAR